MIIENNLEILKDKLKSVLILESELVFSTILKHIVKSLVDEPFIAHAKDITIAMNLLKYNTFDLLILDVSLNNFYCTTETIFSIKKDFPAMKIIIVSATIILNQRAYHNAGIHAFVKKSGDIKSDLSEAICFVWR